SPAEPVEELGVLGANPVDRGAEPFGAAGHVFGDCGPRHLLHRPSFLGRLATQGLRFALGEPQVHCHGNHGTGSVPRARALGDQPSGRALAGCAVGIVRPKNSAISAITAITESDDRSASSRAVLFSLTISSAVCLGTPALSSAA